MMREDNIAIHYNLGIVYFYMNQLNNSVKSFTRMIQLMEAEQRDNPEKTINTDAYFFLARTYTFMAGNLDNAIAYCRRAIKNTTQKP